MIVKSRPTVAGGDDREVRDGNHVRLIGVKWVE